MARNSVDGISNSDLRDIAEILADIAAKPKYAALPAAAQQALLTAIALRWLSSQSSSP